MFAGIVLIFYALDPKVLSPANVTNILNQASILMVVAVAASLVIFTGGFDLSAGAVVAFTGVIAGLVVEHTGSVPLGLAAGILSGTTVGAVNGFVVGYFGVSPLIVTLGALNICRGLALIVAGGSAIYSFPGWYTDFGTSQIAGLPSLFVVALIVFVLVAALLRFTTFGVAVYAVGGNSRAARLSGINDRAVRMMTFTLAGGITSIAGLMLAARTGGGEPTAGYLYELEAIAAVVLGGAALNGGEGRLWRSMLGILLLATLGNGLNIVGVHPHWKGVAIGATLILAASVDFLKRRTER
ncbi:MAG: ABC transporter permease [Burkholderiaceae bacterium]|nr:ABC transporter permease [Burkholderiaceae bacterium]